jgi:hypothetical protein
MPTYTGAGLAYPPPVHGGHGFCQSCCHPASKCCCHRECRKESRELLVLPTLSVGDAIKDPANAATFARTAVFRGRQSSSTPVSGGDFAIREPLDVGDAAARVGIGRAFIGGACCVYLSIEYVPQTPTTTSLVLVLVDDNEGTLLAWGRTEQPGAGYNIKECIITTKPGADLAVAVLNMTARVRWCEIFSC